jgi:hypothetical protein
LKLTISFRQQAMDSGDAPRGGIHVEGAGITVTEGCLAIYPDIKSGNCRMIPLDLIAEIRVEEGPEEEAQRKVTSIRPRTDA